MLSFLCQSRRDLESWCRARGFPEVHAATLFRQTYKSLHPRPWEHPGLPRRLAGLAPDSFSSDAGRIQSFRVSEYDRSVKFLIAFADGTAVETVLMPEKNRVTLCLSSQAGCAQGCVFCHTGRMGLQRQLQPGEIIGQWLLAGRWLQDHPGWLQDCGLPAGSRISNLVFMGMGEPLDNVDGLSGALAILTDPLGPDLSLRRIAVSTAGHLPGLREFTSRWPGAALALSLHHPDDVQRSRLMPINRRWPLTDVLGFLRRHYAGRPRGAWLLVQYTVIAGRNDGIPEAEALVELLRGIPVKVNLIPLNPVDVLRMKGPQPDRLHAFRDHIHQAGVRVMIRYSKGQDIDAACGQLVHQDRF